MEQKVEEVRDVHGRDGERQVEFVEHPEKEPLAWRVQVEAQQRENPQNPAKKHTESWG